MLIILIYTKYNYMHKQTISPYHNLFCDDVKKSVSTNSAEIQGIMTFILKPLNYKISTF